MKHNILKSISYLVLVAFSTVCLQVPMPTFAQVKTGTIKIFSEVKGVQIFIDEKLYGSDLAEVKNIEVGSHYVKAVKEGVAVFSELVVVTADTTTTILIKDTGQVQQKIMDSKYNQQQEYKSKKIDILLSKSYQTEGSSYTSSTAYPGYYVWFGSDWTTSKSTQYEVTDWKIVRGGVQQISDWEFAKLVNDQETMNRMDKDMDDYLNTMNWGAAIGVTGVLLCLVGLAGLFATDTAVAETGAVLFAVGVVPTIIGLGMVSKEPPSGHYVSPGQAAKQAYNYNQELKKKLGLPESYEPSGQ